jgi:2,3-dihydro-2,3-dihydroxybenzoate dehydrogenase
MDFQKADLGHGRRPGIGCAMAAQFAALGGDVVGLDKTFAASSYPFATVRLDVSERDQVQKTCRALFEECPRLDVLVSAAGVLRLGSTEELSFDDWSACMNVNASGPFHLFQQTIPQFKRQRSGAIVSVGSNAAHTPRMLMSAYCASKAAVTDPLRGLGSRLWRSLQPVSLAPLTPPCSAPCGARQTPRRK